MSRQYNIHWRRSDYSKLSHLIRKANKKIFEIEVKRPDISGYQPEMLDYQEVKASIKTRQDLNNFLNKYNRYLREGVEETVKSDRGAVASKWAIHEFEIAQRAENTRRRAKAKREGEQTVTIAGKETDVKRAEMGRIRDLENKASNKKFKNMSSDDWKHAFRQFEKMMNSNYREEGIKKHMRNYIKGLIAEGYSDDLINILSHVKPEDFEKVFGRDELAWYDFIYDPMELKAKQELLIELWEPYVDDLHNNHFPLDEINDEVKYEYQNAERIKGQGRVRRSRKRRKR